MIDVINKIEIYEIDGKEVPTGESKVLEVLSHWNRPNMVVIKIEDKRYTVAEKELVAAIKNATNTARF